MNARSLARALGGDVVGRLQVVCPGPGHSPKDRSLSVFIDWQAPDGFRVHPHAPGDDWRDCRDHIKRLLGIDNTSCTVPGRASRRRVELEISSSTDPDRTERAMAIWNEARPCPAMTVLDAYLASRGLHLLDDVRQADALRFHPACPFKLKDKTTIWLPAMVGLMVDIFTNKPTGIHRTALKPDGSGKAEMPDGSNPKKMYGPAKGAVVKLTSDEDVHDGLGITEGIEDALTVICAGWRPVWAALSAGGVASFPVLPGIECLTIFGDADPTGLVAAQECQARWRAAGRECPIVLPPHDGTDWNAWRAA